MCAHKISSHGSLSALVPMSHAQLIARECRAWIIDCHWVLDCPARRQQHISAAVCTSFLLPFNSLALCVLQELLKSNMQQNLQLVVQVAKEYTEQLGAGKIIELLENNKTYHGLYIAFSEDPEVHFK